MLELSINADPRLQKTSRTPTKRAQGRKFHKKWKNSYLSVKKGLKKLTLTKSRTPFRLTEKKMTECKFCSYSHFWGNCPAYNQICNTCKKRNHFVKMCPSNKHVKEIMQNDSDSPASEDEQANVGFIMAKTVTNKKHTWWTQRQKIRLSH